MRIDDTKWCGFCAQIFEHAHERGVLHDIGEAAGVECMTIIHGNLRIFLRKCKIFLFRVSYRVSSVGQARLHRASTSYSPAPAHGLDGPFRGSSIDHLALISCGPQIAGKRVWSLGGGRPPGRHADGTTRAEAV